MITVFSRESIVGNGLWSWKILEQIQKRKGSRIRRAQVATSHLVIMEDINWGTPYYNKRRELIPTTTVDSQSSFCWLRNYFHLVIARMNTILDLIFLLVLCF